MSSAPPFAILPCFCQLDCPRRFLTGSYCDFDLLSLYQEFIAHSQHYKAVYIISSGGERGTRFGWFSVFSRWLLITLRLQLSEWAPNKWVDILVCYIVTVCVSMTLGALWWIVLLLYNGVFIIVYADGKSNNFDIVWRKYGDMVDSALRIIYLCRVNTLIIEIGTSKGPIRTEKKYLNTFPLSLNILKYK